MKKKRKLQKKQLSIIRDLSGEENSSNFTGANGKRERSKTFDMERPTSKEYQRLAKGVRKASHEY